jgi:hypothetical protein
MVAAAGCVAHDDADELGSVTLNLAGQAPSGNVYRLRDATITVRGPTTTRVWNTEDAPDRASLSADVVAGSYSAALQDGWRIERVDGLSTTTLPAQLLSDNPMQFTVAFNQRTNVGLRFRVADEDVDTTQGYDITLGIQEPAPPVLVVTNNGNALFSPSVTVFSADASGDVAPLRTITGAATTLTSPVGVTATGDQIIVCDAGANALDVFPLTADGNVAPARRIAGPSTGLATPLGVAVSGGEIFVSQSSQGRGAILVFPLAAAGDVAPVRTITGLHSAQGIAIDGGEIFVTDAFNNRFVVYPITASGAAPPARTIEDLTDSSFCPNAIASRRGEIFVTDDCFNGVLVSPGSASDQISPLRQIGGAQTGFVSLQGLALFRGQIYVATSGNHTIRIVPAAASGDIAPVRVIGGPSTHLAFPTGVFVF